MSKLNLSVAIGDYDRNRPLIDGHGQIEFGHSSGAFEVDADL